MYQHHHIVLVFCSVHHYTLSFTIEHMNYLVACPATDEREVCPSQEHAIDVCYSMHKESGHYAYVEDYLGYTVCEYGDINKSPGYNKPYDIEDDCYMSYNSMEVV